jgi:hypothetical protein
VLPGYTMPPLENGLGRRSGNAYLAIVRWSRSPGSGDAPKAEPFKRPPPWGHAMSPKVQNAILWTSIALGLLMLGIVVAIMSAVGHA